MQTKTTTELTKTFVLTLTMTDQDLRDFGLIVGFDLTIPEGISSSPTDPTRIRVERMLTSLQEAVTDCRKA